MDEELESQLNDLASAARILAIQGHEDFTQGHVSLRDPDGRGVWLKRRGIGLGEVMGAEDFVLIDFNGRKIAGEGRSHSEWPIHTEVLRARPEIQVSAHTHPEYATLVAALDTKLKLVTQDGMRIRGREVAYYEESADLIQSVEAGRKLADALGDAWVVIMRNHGVSFFAASPQEIALAGTILERACRTFIRLLATGAAISEPDAEKLTALPRASHSETFIQDNWRYLLRRLQAHETGERVEPPAT